MRTTRPASAAHRLAALATEALVLTDSPLVAEDPGVIGVVGPTVAARAVARALVASALAAIPPVGVTVAAPLGESWVELAPHRGRAAAEPAGAERGAAFTVRRGPEALLLVLEARQAATLPVGCRLVLELGAGEGGADLLLRDGAPEGRVRELRALPLTAVQAAAAATALAEAGRRLGLELGAEPPERVSFAEVAGVDAGSAAGGGSATGAAGALERGPLAAVLGRDADGPVVVDLATDGPHAVVAGTTGSGKSELLVTWVLALAASRPPSELGFLLVDFKGGATFDPLAALPHIRGIVTDLGPRTTRRALTSLRAELRRREEVLRVARAASVDTAPPGLLARLVVVIDEVAALLEGEPELHDVLVDVASRGRSLGVHLMLCTQRPTGVVRDAALANIALRICLRVADPAESTAVLGSPAAARLADAPAGRAVLRDGAGERVVQLARAEPADVAAVAAAWPATEPPAADGPSPEPLPAD
ncbi:MAG: hypothetical protein J0H99_11720, partial [Rhodospirillales bacterium]|nr:hypothetical protein [Rhodospirillales bacterium]